MQERRQMEYRIAYRDVFFEHFYQMTADEQKLITRKIELLRANPAHRSLRTKILRTKVKNQYESSVSMDIRIIWQLDGDQILFIDVGHHDITKKYG